MERRERAGQLFLGGCNCSQAVACAFSDLVDIDEQTLAKAASSFGGGLGRLREVCGAVSGMCMIAGLLYGTDTASSREEKQVHYELIQKLAKKFEQENGSIVCRELLGLDRKHDDPVPEARTEQYYRKRPCAELVKCAVQILEEEIQKRQKENQ